MIFVDSNIPMYLIGEEHPNKTLTLAYIEKFAIEKRALVTNTEVFQEILHRYSMINRREAIQPAFDALQAMADKVFDVTEQDVMEAKNLILSHKKLSARDALHAAQIKHHKIKTIFTFDTGFDELTFLERIPK